jgi:hypothetical protein
MGDTLAESLKMVQVCSEPENELLVSDTFHELTSDLPGADSAVHFEREGLNLFRLDPLKVGGQK